MHVPFRVCQPSEILFSLDEVYARVRKLIYRGEVSPVIVSLNGVIIIANGQK